LLSVLVVASVRPAHAAAFIVNNAGDTPDATPGDGICATAGAVCTLRAAIMEANALAGADTITFATGLGTVTLFSSLPTITQALTITGLGAGTTVIDGNNLNRAFNVAAATTVTISSLTVQHAVNQRGPALTNLGNVTLTAVTFTLNQASTATPLAGIGGAISNAGTLTITGSTISTNAASALIFPVTAQSGGGGIENSGTLTMSLSHVTGSSASVGGGVSNSGTFSASDSDFTGNTATAISSIFPGGSSPGTGGGITSSAGSLTLNRVTVSGNTAQASGSPFPPNFGGQGGGVMVNGGASSFTDVTVSGNTAGNTPLPPLPGSGGGIMIASGTLATLVNVTIASNAAGAGRGSNLQGFNASLKNVILSDPLGAGTNCSAAPTDAGHNLESANSCGFTAAGDIINGNANLGALAANGGPTQTRALGAGSQAIDAGDNVGCPAVDQRGVIRPLGAACDIGAYEFAPQPAVTALNPTQGPEAGGTSVAITGSGFTGATGVAFGATAATGFAVISNTQVNAFSPAGTGTVDVRVTGPGGTSPAVAADLFAYIPPPTVTGLAPTSGPTAGGTSVVITGTNFTGVDIVAFGSTAAASFTVNSATQITAVSPAGTGTVDVRVHTPGGGGSAVSGADLFTFVAAPAPTPTPTPTIGLPPTGQPAPGGGMPWALALVLLALLSMLGLAWAWRRD
jgi:CSLREA domain-containing protein